MRLGGTMGLTWTVPTSFGDFKLSGGYGIQYNQNRWDYSSRNYKDRQGPEKGNNGLDHFWSLGAMWSW